LTFDGQLFGPARYKEITKERYLISKNLNTSYTDTKDITPTERTYLLQFLAEDLEREQKILNQKSS